MSQKHSLYKPATKCEPPSRPGRRPLAQGRLISTEDSVSETLDGDIFKTPPKRHVKPLKTADALNSPRSHQPSMTVDSSPKLRERSQMLDLSDIENNDDMFISPRKNLVYVASASKKTKSPDVSEVDIKLDVEESPARVICHSPSAVHSNLRNTGQVIKARRIAVDQVPSINIMGANDDKDPVITPRKKSPQVLRFHDNQDDYLPVKGSDEATGNLYFSSKDVEHVAQVPAPDVVVERHNDARMTTKQQKFTPRKQNKTVSSESLSRNTSKKLPTGMTNKPSSDGLKQRKKGRVVPSRYMSSAAAAANKSKTFDSTASLGTSLGTSLLARSLIKSKTPKLKKTQEKILSVTPERGGKGKKASTPNSDISNHSVFSANPDGDISEISMVSAISHDDNFDVSVSRVHQISSRAQQIPKSPLPKSSSQPQTKKTIESQQAKLDALYSRYLQWDYLKHYAKKSFQEQEKQAMSQLFGLWELVEEQEERAADLRRKINQVKNSNCLEDVLNTQEQGLNPVVNSLKNLTSEHKLLAEALDTTRHQISTKHIYIPQNEDEFQGAIDKALLESEQLLGELSVIYRSQQNQISQSAETLNELEKTTQTEMKELERITELVAAAKSLTVEESSLKIQDMAICDSSTLK